MPQRIAINSQSTGKFTTEVINNRPHIVTEMVSIVGDSVMNGLLYSNSEVASSFGQLDQLPAPAAHPTINGENISASHPLAINAFHVGGMVRKPRMVGKQVINELVFDIEVAEKDERGKAILDRIRNGEAIGVSTGLNASVNNQSGKIGNTEFKGIVSNIKFDHVAILLDEKPAGSETFTINSDDEVMIVNLAESVNELREKVQKAAQEKFGATDPHAHVWVVDVLFTPDRAILEMNDGKMLSVPFGYNDAGDVVFTGEGVEVKRVETFETVGDPASSSDHEENDMDKLAIVLAIIGNSANRYTNADKDSLMAMSEDALINAVHAGIETPAPTVDQAQVVIEAAGMTINKSDFDADGYADFLANADGFKSYLEDKDKAKQVVIATILKNSTMTKEMVEKMEDDAIEKLANSLVPKGDFSLKPGAISNNDRQIANADDSDVDLTPLH